MSSEATEQPQIVQHCGNHKNTSKRSKIKKVDKTKESSELIKLSSAFHDDGSSETNPIISLQEIVPSTDNNSSTNAPTIHRRKMLIQYGKELVCLLALALTTYATLHNGPPKIARAPPPIALFPKGSLVNEWPSGQLNIVQNKVSTSELSLVLFYAPWCAESQFAKHAYETVANLFHKDIYFAAVNCWQPNGECRLQYSKVQSWPVLMAYYPQGIAVQYQGPWLTKSLTKFIKGLLQPYKRITNEIELLKLKIDNDAVVVGFFETIQNKTVKKFQYFVQTAIKWLEKDPNQDVQFAMATGKSCENFGIKQMPIIRIYLWNETMDMQLDSKWTTENLTKWVQNHLYSVTKWIYPPGRKATTISPFLKLGPVLLFFTPKDYFSSNKDAYHMLKQVAIEFNNCNKDTLNVVNNFTNIYLHRKENSDYYAKLKSKCSTITESSKQEKIKNYYKKCHNDDPNVTFANILNNSKYYKFNEDSSDEHCYIGPKLKDSSCDRMLNKQWRTSTKTHLSHDKSKLYQSYDSRSPENIINMSTNKECQELSLAMKSFGNIYFENQKLDNAEFTTKACDFNRTFSFLLIDSILYSEIAERLGVDVLHMRKKSAIVILDHENDSTYQMNEDISTQTILKFIQNFINGVLERKLRINKVGSETLTINASLTKEVSIKELNSKDFKSYIDTTSNNTLVMFYSVQCALCGLISQTLLTVSKILEPINIDFFRIDADVNDLLWEYTMDSYPTVVIFPRNKTSDSRAFPRSLEVNVSNMLGFVIANLNQEERLLAILESCRFIKMYDSIQNCLRVLRNEISNSISFNLRKWRHHTKLRSETVRRLQILQRIYLISFQINNFKTLGFIRKEIMQFNKN